MKFKVGDKVKIIANSGLHAIIHEKPFKIGAVFKITEIDNSDMTYNLDNIYWCYEYELELVNKKTTKEDLFKMPIGTKITTNLEECNVFVKIDEENFINEDDKYMCDEDIDGDFLITDDELGTRILKIERPTYETIYNYSDEIQEMTISQIEKVLGHKVKIINNEEEK